MCSRVKVVIAVAAVEMTEAELVVADAKMLFEIEIAVTEPAHCVNKI